MMNLKRFLEENLQRYIDTNFIVCLEDEEYMQGVNLFTDKPNVKAEDIINDKPVQKFWDYLVIDVDIDRCDGIVYITVEETQNANKPN